MNNCIKHYYTQGAIYLAEGAKDQYSYTENRLWMDSRQIETTRIKINTKSKGLSIRYYLITTNKMIQAQLKLKC